MPKSSLTPHHSTPPAGWPPFPSDDYLGLRATAKALGISHPSLLEHAKPGHRLHPSTVEHPTKGTVFHVPTAARLLSTSQSTHPDSYAMRHTTTTATITTAATAAPAAQALRSVQSVSHGDDDATQLRKAKLIREQYAARLAKLEFDKASAQVVPLASAKIALFNAARECRNVFTAIPDRLASLLAATDDPHLCRELLRTEIDAALSTLANTTLKLGDDQ